MITWTPYRGGANGVLETAGLFGHYQIMRRVHKGNRYWITVHTMDQYFTESCYQRHASLEAAKLAVEMMQ